MARYWFSAILVALAVATMIALGIWQIQRSSEKADLRATYAANQQLAVVPLKMLDYRDTRSLFRRVSARCERPFGIAVDAGRAALDGATGWRHIATCAADGQNPEMLVDIGVSPTPDGFANWTGGNVVGTLVTEPQRYGVISRLLGRAPPLRPMIVAETSAPGLAPSAQPDPRAMPDDHLSYAMQWFIFAFAASAIFLLALRQRLRRMPRQSDQD